ncbi:MAG: hypothetical protein WA874_19490 [Chryseosolibacter sp.]
MGKDRNIVHQYFKKELDDAILLVKVNPLQFKVTEITVYRDQDPELRELEVDEDIVEDLRSDGFTEASPLEFNLYLSGLMR